MQSGAAEIVPHAHLWPLSASIQAGHLRIGDIDLGSVAERYGTPVYVLDGMTIRTIAARYNAVFRGNYGSSVHIHYASKALLNLGLAQLMHKLGLGLDVVSAGELYIAQQAGVPAQHIHLHGNATPVSEFKYAIEQQVGRIVVDNSDQLHILHALTKNRNTPQSIMLRIAPDSADTSAHAHIQTGAATAKFGIPIQGGLAAQAVNIALRCPGLQLDGLHMHIGSQIRDWQTLRTAIDTMFNFIVAMREQYNWIPRLFSPGGGLGVAYQPQDSTPDIERYAQTITQTIIHNCERWGIQLPQLIIEPGRSMIARAGVALYRITGSKKVTNGPTFIHIDGGMGDNIRPSLYNAPYTAVLIEQPTSAVTQHVNLAGRYCESGDVLIRDLALPPTKLGDILAVPMAGAYTLSMSSTYNGVPRPALVLVEEQTVHVLQRRETWQDLLLRDQPLTME